MCIKQTEHQTPPKKQIVLENFNLQHRGQCLTIETAKEMAITYGVERGHKGPLILNLMDLAVI